jgi:hypothetical protein
VGGRRRRAAAGRRPLSFGQQRLWLIDQLDPGSAAYNIPLAIRLHGRLRPAVLAAAVGEIVRRHEVLRTTFERVEGEPVQVVHDPAPLPLPLIDLGALPEGRRRAETRRVAAAEAARPFDLARGPLMRLTAVRVAPDEHLVVANLHHVISDGWSLGVLVRELSVLYRAIDAGRPSPLAELPLQYADFARWQRRWLTGAELERQLAWWREQVGVAPEPLALPTDRPRPAIQRLRGAVEVHRARGLGAAVGRLVDRTGITRFMVLLAGFQALLGRYTGQERIAVGSPIANRTRAELEGLIGFFANTLVLTADLGAGASFRELLAQVQETTLGA